MLTFTEAQVIQHIGERKPFEAILEEGGLKIKIERYIPCVVTAIHNGHNLRAKLNDLCLLDEHERYYEEDPHTGSLADNHPISLVALDSRYEYDLNRSLSTAIYQVAWGKTVWSRALSAKQKAISHEKHKRFYRILEYLITELEAHFGACIVFDLHTYNYRRLPGEPPTFNLGTQQIDLERWGSVADFYESVLGAMTLTGNHRTARNEVFEGRGYLISYVNAQFTHTLVLPTEIRKYFMDEVSGELFPDLLKELMLNLTVAIDQTVDWFTKHHVKKTLSSVHGMPISISDMPFLKEVDAQLFHLAKGINTLQAIAPLNLQSEKQRFLKREGRYQPNFQYKPLQVDPYWFREQLYHLPVARIEHPLLSRMYRDVIDMLAIKIDLLTSIGTERFLYNSLRYYGEPKASDLKNAEFLFRAPPLSHEVFSEKNIDADQAVDRFRYQVERWGYDCQVQIGRKMIAKALVHHGSRALLVNRHSYFTETEIQALCHHELGVHMVTTLNSRLQPLKIFELGLPGNTKTQEGLAILMEELSGHLTLNRLKILALRVLAVHHMIQHNDICKTFLKLRDQFDMEAEDAFDVAIRVHRGGGFTKDFLYLSGLRDALQLYRKNDITPLLIGKTGFDYYSDISQLIEEGTLERPHWLSPALGQLVKREPVLVYLISAIR